MKRLVKDVIRSAGYEVVRSESHTLRQQNPDITDEEWRTFIRVKPYTMTSLERIVVLIRATAHVVEAGIPGDFVECGVWRGGSAMAMALTLNRCGDMSRRIHLYDTFEGMTAPTEADADVRGTSAASMFEAKRSQGGDGWACASLDEVRRNMEATGCSGDRIQYVAGPVERTIPGAAPARIALLRLDTDWYESTRHELNHLYPRLAHGGILIVDDYGYWQGARRAVDEYFAENGPVFLNRIDYTGRLVVKPLTALPTNAISTSHQEC